MAINQSFDQLQEDWIAASRLIDLVAYGTYTQGSYTGGSFAPFDFSNGGADTTANEVLVLEVDGVDQTITLSTAITSAADAVAALAGLSGAAASVDGTNVAITSALAGTGSTVSIGGGATPTR